MPKKKCCIQTEQKIIKQLKASAKEIIDHNAPALKSYGLHKEARARELAAMFVLDQADAIVMGWKLDEVTELLNKVKRTQKKLKELRKGNSNECK